MSAMLDKLYLYVKLCRPLNINPFSIGNYRDKFHTVTFIPCSFTTTSNKEAFEDMFPWYYTIACRKMIKDIVQSKTKYFLTLS